MFTKDQGRPGGFVVFTKRKMELGANVKAIKGTAAAFATSGPSKGYIVPVTATTGLRPIGRFTETVDNTGGAVGAKKAEVNFHRKFELVRWANDTVAPLAKADRGSFCFGKDNETCSADGDGRSYAGIFWEFEGTQVLVEPHLALLTAPETAQVLKKSVTIAYNHASLVAEGDDGDAVDIAVGSALPAGAVLVGHRYTITSPFAGAGVASLALKVGFAGDTDGVFESVDIFGDAAGEYRGVPGTAMGGPAGGKQLLANLDPDNAAGLDELTGGSVTIDVFYFVAA